MSGEKLELVTEFGSLRAGMLVVLVGCHDCGERHRGVLVRFVAMEPIRGPDAVVSIEANWEALPAPSCEERGLAWGVTHYEIAERRLFRVIDDTPAGAETDHTEETERPRVKERAR